MAFLPRPVTRMMLSTPDRTASSTPYWIIGLSTSGSISFGCAFVAGRNRVPKPAAGKTAFRTDAMGPTVYDFHAMLDPNFLREHPEVVSAALRNRGVEADKELEALAVLEARRRRLIPEMEG